MQIKLSRWLFLTEDRTPPLISSAYHSSFDYCKNLIIKSHDELSDLARAASCMKLIDNLSLYDDQLQKQKHEMDTLAANVSFAT